jgi:uncharacterized membrane protein YphA (DoxX/SURF4 family)
MNMPALAQASRIALVLIFVAAAPHKIMDPAQFAQNVAGYQVLPDLFVNVTALVLPWLEMLVAILLLCRTWTGPALFLANAMFAVFLGVIVSAHLRGLDVDCGCFSNSAASTASMTWYMTRDAAFLILGGLAAWLHRQEINRS